LAEADLIERDDAKIRGKRLDGRHPAGAFSARSMQQNHRIAATSLKIMNPVTEDGCIPGCRRQSLVRAGLVSLISLPNHAGLPLEGAQQARDRFFPKDSLNPDEIQGSEHHDA
jgi:hypothetical protein